MHGRNGLRQLAHLVCVAAAVGVAGCATAPPQHPENDAIRELRANYLHEFPDGPHNDQIRRGEVVRGMSLYEVLASWGIPDQRVVSQTGDRERWVYVLFDDLSLDWVCYEYEFRNNALHDWTEMRGVANGLSLDTPDERVTAMSLPAWAGDNQRGGAPRR